MKIIKDISDNAILIEVDGVKYVFMGEEKDFTEKELVSAYKKSATEFFTQGSD